MTSVALLHNLLPMVEKHDIEALPIRYPDFARRLQQAMTDKGISVTDIKNQANVSYEMARRYTLGQAMPRQERLARLASVVGSTASYLAFGTTPISGSDEVPGFNSGSTRRTVVALSADETHPGAIQIRKVKLRLSAGIAGFAVDPVEEDDSPVYLPEAWLKKRGYRRQDLLAIDIAGQSMETTLYHGDTAIINTTENTPIDGEVYAVNYEGEAVVKRLIKDCGFWWLVSDNPDQRRFPRKQCSGDMCIIIGKVVRKESETI